MNTAELKIAHLKLQLPSELDRRAKVIGQLFSEQLADLRLKESKHIESLKINHLDIQLTQSNTQIARKIAQAVQKAIEQ